MAIRPDRHFSRLIDRLIRKDNLTRAEAGAAFRAILEDEPTDMQQGAS